MPGLFPDPSKVNASQEAAARPAARPRRPRSTETPRVAPRRTAPPLPPPSADLAAPWPPELRPAIDFLQLATADHPREPFQLRPGEFVADPAAWLAGLRLELAHGPEGSPRTTYGALQADLHHLRELFGRGHSQGPNACQTNS